MLELLPLAALGLNVLNRTPLLKSGAIQGSENDGCEDRCASPRIESMVVVLSGLIRGTLVG